MFGLHKTKHNKQQISASTILRLCLVFQLVFSCTWSPSFAQASDTAKTTTAGTTIIDATADGAAKVEKIKLASVDTVVDEAEKAKKKKSKLKPVKLPKAEAKLIALSDREDTSATQTDSKVDAKAIASKPAATTGDSTKVEKTESTKVEKTKSDEAVDAKDADGKSKTRWFRRAKTDEEKAAAETKAKADDEAAAKKAADEKAGKELAKKAAAEAKAKAKADKASAKKEKESKADSKEEAKAEPTEKATPVTAAPANPVVAIPATATPATTPTTTPAATPAETKVDGANAAAAPATSGDGKLVAVSVPVEKKETATPAATPQRQSTNLLAGGEGIGGFVSSEDQKELAFLHEGRVEETIGDLNVIVIDNDEAVEIEETIAYEELPTDDGKTKIKTGAQFPVVLQSQLSSETAKEGDIVQGRLKYDLKIGNKLIAKKGDLVRGRITYKMKARSVMHSLVSPHRWYRNSGVLGFQFDEIISHKGEHIKLNAKPARKGNIIKNKAEGRLLGVNHNGEITGPWAQQLRWKAIRIGMNFAMAPAGVFSFGAMPVALGVMGAINPSFAFMKPVGTNVPHRRIKGFFWGALSGVPGSWIIEDTVTKGQPCIVKPGDEFLVELQQEFTGEAITSAEMLPGAGANVRSEVEGATKKNTVKGKKTKKK